MKRYTAIGVCVTVVWLIGAALLVYAKRGELASMPLNAWGDFFAGAVAPLAFLWLVLGYVQQGEELRVNTEALLLQHAELQRQVQETAALAKSSERQAAAAEQLALATRLETERAELKRVADAQPVFSARGGQGISDNHRIYVVNEGARVTDLRIEAPARVTMSFTEAATLAPGARTELVIRRNQEYPFDFTIVYRDALQVERRKTFTMPSDFTFREHAT